MTARFLHAGDTAVVVEFGDRVDRAVSESVLSLSARVREARLTGITETVPTYRSLLVHFDPLATDSATVVGGISKLLGMSKGAQRDKKLWRLPACFEPAYAPDLDEVAARAGLNRETVIELLSETPLHVYMVGFSPGFPYMGDLPQALNFPRRTDPRVKVPAGSIAIAVGMVGIYPVESPGGWHLVGTTPVRLFNVHSERPALLAPGDTVRFDSVSTTRFDQIRAAVAASSYKPSAETIAA